VGLVLLVLAVLLFSPVIYDADAVFKDEDYSINAVLRYLVLKVKYNSDDGKVQYLLPFGMNIDDLKNSDKSNKKQKSGVKVNENGKNTLKQNSADSSEKQAKTENTNKTEKPNINKANTNKAEKAKASKSKPKSQSFFEKLVSKIKKIIDFIKKASKKPMELYNKAVEFLAEIKAANEKYHFKVLINETFLFFKRFFKALGLKKFRICGIIGLEDPSDTGTLIGAVSVVGAFVPIEKDISGDFQNKNLDIKAELKGKTCLFVLIYEIARYALNKNVLPVLKEYSGID
jgi:hypothetical protein